MAESAQHEEGARRTGRWRTGQQSRQRILDAARAQFMRHGYRQSSVRAIAAEAGVDVAMVYYFFGSKNELFAAVLVAPEHPLHQLDALLAEGIADIGPRLVRRCLELWDAGEEFQPLLALWHSAANHQLSSDLLRQALSGSTVDRLSGEFGIGDAPLRVELVTVHLMGLAVARYHLRLDTIANASRETLTAWVGPTIQQYLAGAESVR